MKQLLLLGVISLLLNACSQSNLKDMSGDNSISKTGNSSGLSLAQGNTVNYGMMVMGDTESKILTILNTGSVTATNISALSFATGNFLFSGNGFPGQNGNCTSTLNSGQQCTIEVIFKPLSQLASASDKLQIVYSQNGTSLTLAATLTASSQTPANLSLVGVTADLIDFGAVTLSKSSTQTITITNTGAQPATQVANSLLSSSGFSLAGGSFPGTGGTCETTITAGTTCTLVFSFNPTTAENYTTISQLNYQNGIDTTELLINFSGTGQALANLVFSNSIYNFGSIFTDNSATLTLSLSNQGSTTATNLATTTLPSPFSYLGSNYPGTGGTCGASLSASATCTIVLDFSPTVVGVSNDTLSLNYLNGSVNTTTSTTLTGLLQQPALLSISNSPTYNFGSVLSTLNATKIFTVSNLGSATATNISYSGLTGAFNYVGGSFPGTGGTCSTSLAASASCTVAISFTPTVRGTSTGSLILNYSNGATTANSSIGLTGIMQAPALLTIIGAPSYNFGSTLSNTTLNNLFTVTNTGDVSATNLNVTGLAIPFNYVGGSYPGTGGTCETTLLSASSCQIAISFSPTVRGLSSGNLTLNYATGLTSTSVSLALSGTMNIPAALTMSSSPTFSFGSIFVNTITPTTFTVTNSGDVPATSLTISGLNTPFNYVGGNYPGTGGTCGTSLANATSCTTIISFSPLAVGTFNDSFVLQYNNGTATQSLNEALSGIATFQSGTLDSTFGTLGIADFNVLGHGNSYVKKLGVQSDGSLVAVGSASNGTDLNIVTGKFNASGNPLTSYGTAGFQSIASSSSNYYGTGIAFDSSSNVYIVGNSTSQAVFSKILNTTGLLDSTFGFSGETVVNLSSYGVTGNFPSLNIESNGSFIISGSCGEPGWSVFCVGELNANGSFNNNFGISGILSTINFGNMNDYISKTLSQSSDYLVSAGYYLNNNGHYNLGLTRFSPYGVVDTSFGSSGLAKISITNGNQYLKNLVRLSNDEMVAVVIAQNNSASYGVYAVKFTANGALDTTFNSTGYVYIDSWGSTTTSDFGIDIQSDSKIVIGGYKSNGSSYNFAIARINTNGTLDSTFGTNGEQVITNVQSSTDSDVDLLFHPNGDIIIGGKNQSSGQTLMSLRAIHM
jgi:uncharacterized delta-60 repeat protein